MRPSLVTAPLPSLVIQNSLKQIWFHPCSLRCSRNACCSLSLGVRTWLRSWTCFHKSEYCLSSFCYHVCLHWTCFRLSRSREHAGSFYNTDGSNNHLSNSLSQKWFFNKVGWHVILYQRVVGLHERRYSQNILMHIPVTKNRFLIFKLLCKYFKETNDFHAIYPSLLK